MSHSSNHSRIFRSFCILFLLSLQAIASSAGAADTVTYTNMTLKGPISVYVVRIPRSDRALEIESIHSAGKAIGLATVSEQLKMVATGNVVAAVNGDFYVREGGFAGDPRGLQIVNGELISAPVGSTSFWIDADNEPHIELTKSEFQITWPNGTKSPFGLNAKCEPNQLQLYTSTLGTLPAGDVGREIVLAPAPGQRSAALHPGREYTMKVVAVRAATNAAIEPGTCVLLVGPSAAKTAPTVQPGAQIKISTATTPRLHGVKSAISGGPTIVKAGKAQRFDKPAAESYQYSSMIEKHPRSALGWNQREYFWVEVDGRQKDSVGMTLNELGAFMVDLGCDEAMNLDGGGSSTLWFEGAVRNHPCDGYERPVANSLALVRKAASPKK
jgi:hypothetical protein